MAKILRFPVKQKKLFCDEDPFTGLLETFASRLSLKARITLESMNDDQKNLMLLCQQNAYLQGYDDGIDDSGL